MRRTVDFLVPTGVLVFFTALGGLFVRFGVREWVFLLALAMPVGVMTSLVDSAVARRLPPSETRDHIRDVAFSLSMLPWFLGYLIYVESMHPIGVMLFFIPAVAVMAWFGLG